jgi:hypothetical protein
MNAKAAAVVSIKERIGVFLWFMWRQPLAGLLVAYFRTKVLVQVGLIA